MRGRLVSLLWIALSASSAGCRSLPPYMREVDPVRMLKAPADQSLIVFVRPPSDDELTVVHVMDDRSTFLGTAIPGGHFSVVRPVGRQQFIIFCGDVADAVVADLAPGLVYFVELVPAGGPGPARFIARASARGTKVFPYRRDWIEDTAQFRVDIPTAREQMTAEADRRREKVVKDANERLRKYAGVELTEHTLAQTDGHASIGVPGAVRYAVPAPVPVPIPVALPAPLRPTPIAPAPIAGPIPAAPSPMAPRPSPQPAAGPAPASLGFVPEEFPPPPPPGPPPELIPEPELIKRGYMRGTLVRVKLKNGTVWLGAVVRETKLDLKISVGGATHLLDFEDMLSVEELSKR